MKVQAILQPDQTSTRLLPLAGSKIPAGFPSPADDFVEGTLDIATHLIKHPAATFFVRATGDSMEQAGIYTNDILVVDRSLEAQNNDIVIAALDGELTVKRIRFSQKKVTLLPENDSYAPVTISKDHDFHIWGVVTYVIHQTSRRSF